MGYGISLKSPGGRHDGRSPSGRLPHGDARPAALRNSHHVGYIADMDFGDHSSKAASYRLRLTRCALGLIQADLAVVIGCTATGVSGFETTRRPSLDAMKQLSQVYGVSLDWIYRGKMGGMPQGLYAPIVALSKRYPFGTEVPKNARVVDGLVKDNPKDG